MRKLEGKVAIITGSGNGCGKAYAKVFAREGASVTVTCRTASQGEQVVKEIIEEGGKAIYVKGDVCNREDIKKVVSETVKAFGKIDILVNNAQVEGVENQQIELIKEEDIDIVWRSGYMATLFFMQECFPYLKETKGNIINTGSGSATQGLTDKAIYAPVKEAIRNLTYITAKAWGQYGITANTIMPAIATEMYKRWAAEFPEQAQHFVNTSALRKMGDGEKDLAPIVVFLASDDSKYFTGQTVNADGGVCFVR